MSEKTASLWPPDFGDVGVMTPLAILRQQGVALGELTQNIVIGRVKTNGNAQNFAHVFSLWCSPLGFEVNLLQVNHTIDLYPTQLTSLADGAPKLVATGPDELKDKLREIFARPAIKKIVASLFATRQ